MLDILVGARRGCQRNAYEQNREYNGRRGEGLLEDCKIIRCKGEKVRRDEIIKS